MSFFKTVARSIAATAALAVLPLEAASLASLLAPLPEDFAAAEKPAAVERAGASARSGSTARGAAKGAPEQQVEADPMVAVTPREILPELEHQLTRHYNLEGELKVSLLQQWSGTKVRDAAWRIEILSAPTKGLMPRCVVRFRIYCGEESQGDFQLPLACRLHREVLVPRRTINRGETLSLADFETQVRDILESPLPMVPANEDLNDYELKTSVASTQPLLWRDIDPKPLVRKGQVVEAVATEGFMRISMKAVALENGREGDLIAVRNLSSNKDIQARILNGQTVQVFF